MSKDGSFRVCFAGSGTAGHLYPGIRVARDLVSFGAAEPADVVFLGGARGSGLEAIEEAGFTFRVLEGATPIRGRSAGGTVRGLLGTSKAFLEAKNVLAQVRPSVIVGIGGYASFPVLLAAKLLRIPVVVLQVDAVFGLANKIGAVFAQCVLFSFPASRATFDKSLLARLASRRGMIAISVRPCVRPEIEALAVTKDAPGAKRSLGLDSRNPLVVFVGGSLGAGPINDAALEAFARWQDASSPSVVQLTGPRYFESCVEQISKAKRRTSVIDAEERYEGASPKGVAQAFESELAASASKALGVSRDAVFVARTKPAFVVIPFVPRIDRIYCAADVVVARAGAATVSELAASGTPAVLMPSSYVPGDHQRPNAEALAQCGGAVVADDKQSKLVPAFVERLLERPDKLEAMRNAGLQAVAAPRAAYEVVAELAGLRADSQVFPRCNWVEASQADKR